MATPAPRLEPAPLLAAQALEELVALAASSPQEFDAKFALLDIRNKLRIRKELHLRAKSGKAIPAVGAPPVEETPAKISEVASLDALMSEEPAPDASADESFSLDDLFKSDSDEASSLDDLFGGESKSDEGEMSLDDLFGESAAEEKKEEAPEVPGSLLPKHYGVPLPQEVSVSELAEFISGLELFAGIPAEGLKALAGRMSVVKYPEESLIFREGDVGDEMYIVKEGLVKVLLNNGTQDFNIRIPSGGVVGEIALLDGGTRTAALVTAQPTVLVRFRVEGFKQTFEDDPEAGLMLLRNISAVQRERIVKTNKDAIEKAKEAAAAQGQIQQVQEIQQFALPPELPKYGKCEFHVTFTAAKDGVSGDFYDFIEFDENRMIIIFGDSTGHGLKAGLVMLLAKSASFTQAGANPSVSAITEAINNITCRVFGATMFMTFVAMYMDREKRTIRFTNAGQQSHPYIYHMRTGEFTPLESQSFQLGVAANYHWEEDEVTWEPGDLLVCYSDGFIEASYHPGGVGEPERDNCYEDDRLREFITRNANKSPGEFATLLREEVKAFSEYYDTDETPPGIDHYGDDITTVIVRLD